MRLRRRQLKQRDLTDMHCRTFAVRAATFDDEGRSVEAAIATETPVVEWDWERMELVPRVLLASGAVLPRSAQVPLLDSHMRATADNVIGSIRGLRKEAGAVVGRLFFSSAAESAWQKVREGHLTDVSAGFRVLKETYVEPGKTKTIDGREFTGPINVATKWELREGSLVAIGADQAAKLRGLNLNHPHLKGKKAVDEQLRAALELLGMPQDLNDEQARQWLVDNAPALGERLKKPEDQPTEPESQPANRPSGQEGEVRAAGQAATVTADDINAIVRKALEEAERQREDRRAAFRREVDSLTELVGLESMRSELYGLEDIAAVRKRLQEERSRRANEIPGSVRFADHQPRDEGRQAIGQALILRALQGQRPEVIERELPAASRKADAERFRYMRLMDMARFCLRLDGFDERELERMSPANLALAALGFAHQAGLLRADPGYHVTASFPKITQDAINKSMLVGYTEFPATWRGPMRQGTSVPDFKQIHRMRLGAIPNLPVWPTNMAPDQASVADAEEVYAVECYSLAISFDYKVLVNDDMDALSRLPMQLGNAASRTVNAVAWAQLTSNPIMGDGQALLLESPAGNRKQGNYLTTASAVPNHAGLAPLRKLMRTMRGLNTPEGQQGPDVLNLEPRYLVAPAALESQVLETVRSTAKPESEMSSGVYNQWRTLVPVIEPLLDASSEKAFYLFADPSQIDTIEVTFLQGQESPITRNQTDYKTLSQDYTILQTFGAKAMDYRGIVGEKGEA